MAGRGAENTGTTDTLAKFGSTRTGTQNLLMDASAVVKVLLRPTTRTAGCGVSFSMLTMPLSLFLPRQKDGGSLRSRIDRSRIEG